MDLKILYGSSYAENKSKGKCVYFGGGAEMVLECRGWSVERAVHIDIEIKKTFALNKLGEDCKPKAKLQEILKGSEVSRKQQ